MSTAKQETILTGLGMEFRWGLFQFLKALDFITQLSRPLEFKVLRSLFHLCPKLLDQVGTLILGEIANDVVRGDRSPRLLTPFTARTVLRPRVVSRDHQPLSES